MDLNFIKSNDHVTVNYALWHIIKDFEAIEESSLCLFENFFELLPAIEVGEGGGRDVHAVDADMVEEGVAELLDFGGVELFAVGREVVKEGFSTCRGHVTAG